jgi:hypothetical protein
MTTTRTPEDRRGCLMRKSRHRTRARWCGGRGLLLTMMGAAVAHAKRGEYPMLVPPAGLGLIAAYVAYSHLIEGCLRGTEERLNGPPALDTPMGFPIMARPCEGATISER